MVIMQCRILPSTLEPPGARPTVGVLQPSKRADHNRWQQCCAGAAGRARPKTAKQSWFDRRKCVLGDRVVAMTA